MAYHKKQTPKMFTIRGILLISCCTFSAGAQPAADIRYDGHWWVNTKNMQQRQGFLDGESDCYQDDLKLPWNRNYRSNYIARELVDEYYNRSGKLKLLVTDVLKIVKDVKRPERRGGQSHTDKYGYSDGLFWRQGTREANLGYLQGYLSCLPDSARRFPKDPEVYRKLVDDWYRRDNWANEDEKIPNVLRKFAEK